MSRGLAVAIAIAGACLATLALADDARAATQNVAISGFAFQPQTVEIRAGDSVRWTNNDGTAHTATASDGSWGTGTLQTSESNSHPFNAVGTFSYVCSFHSSMTGTVRVTDAPPQNTPPSITLTSPTFGATVSGVVAIAGVASDGDGDALTVSVRVDAGSWLPATVANGHWAFSWNTTDLSNVNYTLGARAFDGVEFTSVPSVLVRVNNAPTLSLATPAERADLTLGRVHFVNGTATKAPNVVLEVAVSVDGGAFRPAQGTTSWSFAWNTSDLAAGNHTLQARARDGTNEVVTPIRNVTLSEPPPLPPNLAPTLVVGTPAQNATVSGIVNVSGTASDPDGPLPRVEVDANGTDWRPITARVGATWWYHWIPDVGQSGNATIRVRATDGNATVMVTRHVVLSASSRALTLDLGSLPPREGRDLSVRVASDAGAAPGARLFLSHANGSAIAERVADATGNATFPALANGSYVLRAFAPGATATLPFVVAPRYDIRVEPLTIDFDQPVPIRVNVSADGPVVGVPVHLTGDILTQGATALTRTALDGTASLGYQAIAAGELAVWVANNDTGIRVRLVPMLRAGWEPQEPVAGDTLTVHFVINDLVRTRAAGATVTVDAPGEPPRNATTDEEGVLTIRTAQAGTLRLDARLDGVRPATIRILVAAPPAIPELRDLTSRVGDSGLLVSVFVKNVGQGNGTFVVDALATSATGTAVQQTARTRELAPGQEVDARFILRVGGGEYTLTASVRNSTQSLSILARMPEVSLPPPLEFNQTDEEVPPTPQGTPGLPAVGLAAAVGIVAFSRRRRRT